MLSQIITATRGVSSGLLRPLAEAAVGYAAAAWAPRTREAYRKQWARFKSWCDAHGLRSSPAEATTVAMYLSSRADEGRKVATIALSLAAIGEAHRVAGHASPRARPEVREVLKGIRRRLGVSPAEKAPLRVEDLRAMIRSLPANRHGIRDRALLALGFAGRFRRCELVGLVVADLTFVTEGLEVVVGRSKTDQEGRGLLKVLRVRPAHRRPRASKTGRSSDPLTDMAAWVLARSTAVLSLEPSSARLSGSAWSRGGLVATRSGPALSPKRRGTAQMTAGS